MTNEILVEQKTTEIFVQRNVAEVVVSPTLIQNGDSSQALQDHINSATPHANALSVSQRLAEFSTSTSRQQARANLELDDIDLGTFN